MKKIASALAAIIMTVSMSVSAGAVDYAQKPNYSLPPSSSSGSTAPKPSAPAQTLPPAGTSFKNPAELLTKDVVKDSIVSGTPICASYEKADIKANAVAALAKTIGQLKVSTKRYDVEIDSDSVTEAKDISLAVKITKISKRGAMVLNTEQEGSFGCTVKLRIKASVYKQCGVDLDKAKVYRIDPDTNKVMLVGAVKLDADGNIVISITDGGKYIVM